MQKLNSETILVQLNPDSQMGYAGQTKVPPKCFKKKNQLVVMIPGPSMHDFLRDKTTFEQTGIRTVPEGRAPHALRVRKLLLVVVTRISFLET